MFFFTKLKKRLPDYQNQVNASNQKMSIDKMNSFHDNTKKSLKSKLQANRKELTMTDHEQIAESSDFKNRKTGLVVFGILQIILGGICALMAPLMIFGMIVSTSLKDSSTTSMNSNMMIPSVLFYVLIAVWFIWMGIGSIKARRWARALLLVSSWIWLISGIIGLVFMLILIPGMYDQMGKSGLMPQTIAVIIEYVTIGFTAVFYVIIPGVLVLFYGSRNVKATCEFHDSRVRWTDKCPLPVLAVSLLFVFSASSMLSIGFYGWVIPFFGFILSGVSGAMVALVGILLLGYTAWGTYKLNIKAWWCAVLISVAWVISIGITFSRVSLLDFYEKMDLPAEQLDIIKQSGIPQNSTMVLLFGLWIIGFLGYLLYTRKYFTHPPAQGSASS